MRQVPDSGPKLRKRWLLAALLLSCLIHGGMLWGPDIALPDWEDPAPLALEAHLAPLPPVATPVPEQLMKPARPKKSLPSPVDRDMPPKPAESLAPAVAGVTEASAIDSPVDSSAKPEVVAATEPMSLPFSPAGKIRFSIYKESLGMEIGRMEQGWTFKAGRYEIYSTTQTVGLAAIFKSLALEQRSVGRFDARGLYPEIFETRKNGVATIENAQFDWASHTVKTGKTPDPLPFQSGVQDILSLFYQLPFVSHLENGARFGVATGKKLIRYDLDALGEETVALPAGEFKTLHLRVQAETVTEIWFAPALGLPVKIRYTDKKGDAFVQLATDIGL